MALAFSGSAEELQARSRRDFLVNVVLGGLYTSLARRHAAEYLATHTTVDGTPLAHVPVRKSRWPALLLVLALVALRVANELEAGPPLPVVVIFGVLVIPYLWGTVTVRTLGAIRWRAATLTFAARWGEIYRASWPLFVLGSAWAIAQPFVADAAETSKADARMVAGAIAAALLAFPLLAALAFNWRRLRFTRTRVGEWNVAWQARFGPYLRLWVVTAAAVLVTAVAPVLLVREALFGRATLQGLSTDAAAAVYATSLVLVYLLSTPARAWYDAKVFVLTWDGLRVGEVLRVECTLDAKAYARMRARDVWRMVCSLGGHRSVSAVNAYRAKLSALRVWAHE